MTLASVQQALEPLGLLDRIVFFEKDATPTVADAARLLGCELRLIAKTMAVKLLSGPALIVLAGAPGLMAKNSASASRKARSSYLRKSASK